VGYSSAIVSFSARIHHRVSKFDIIDSAISIGYIGINRSYRNLIAWLANNVCSRLSCIRCQPVVELALVDDDFVLEIDFRGFSCSNQLQFHVDLIFTCTSRSYTKRHEFINTITYVDIQKLRTF